MKNCWPAKWETSEKREGEGTTQILMNRGKTKRSERKTIQKAEGVKGSNNERLNLKQHHIHTTKLNMRSIGTNKKCLSARIIININEI